MKTIKKMLWFMMGHVIIDEALQQLRGPTVLHISDTPRSFYPKLSRILAILKPDYIIHTGDLADDLKLGIYPNLKWNYEKALIKLMHILNQSSAAKIVIILGNHDDLELARKHAGRVAVYEDAALETFHGRIFSCAHDHKAAEGASSSKTPDYFLFGHDLSLISQTTERVKHQVKYLNGIEAMHLIDLSDGDVHEIIYPIGINNARLNRKRIRL